jgi:hypothetical protein
MPILTATGFALWLYVAMGALLLSGKQYYELYNLWIIGIPLGFFGLALLALILKISRIPREADLRSAMLQSPPARGRHTRFKIINVAGFFASVILLLLVMSTSNADFSSGQALRDEFYSSQRLMMLGGAYFQWVMWATEALIYLGLAFALYDAAIRGKIFTPQLAIVVSSVLMFSSINASRTLLAYAIVLAVGFLFPILRFKLKFRKKTLFSSSLFFFLSVFFIQAIFEWRATSIVVELADSVWVKYFVGPSFALDRFILLRIDEEIVSQLGRIGISLVGVDTVIVSGFLRGVLEMDVRSALGSTSHLFHYGVAIGEGIYMNAHYTAAGRFYIDFGVVGYALVFAALAWGSLKLDLRRVRPNCTARVRIAYAVMFLAVIISSRELLLDSPAIILSLIIGYALIKTPVIRVIPRGYRYSLRES